MFGAKADPREVATEAIEAAEAPGPRIFLPEGDSGPVGPARVTLPHRQSFFRRFPKRWTWETWAKRTEYEWLKMARGLDTIIWASVGSMVGLTVSGIPGIFVDGYHFVVWQPLGAAIGATAGALLVWGRWREAFDSYQEMDG